MILKYFLYLITLLSVVSCSVGEKNEIGTWQRINSQGEKVTVKFHKSGEYSIFIGNFEPKDLSDIKLFYEIDYKAEPHSIILYSSDDKSKSAINSGIIRFVSKDSIQLLIKNEQSNKDLSFNDSGVIGFSRVSENLN